METPTGTKERTMRTTTALKTAAAAGALGLLMAGCGGSTGGDSTDSGETDAATGGNDFYIMEDWKGCDALDNLQSLQDYMGVTGISTGDGELSNYAIGESIDGEAATCLGIMDLATYEAAEYTETGDATVQAGVVPWEDEQTATENFAERLQQLEDSNESGGTEYVNVETGELPGDWDESYYETSNDDDDGGGFVYINAYGRSGDWIVYILLHFTTDPGLRADDEAVYPFSEDELKTWVVEEYMNELQAGIQAKIESEQ